MTTTPLPDETYDFVDSVFDPEPDPVVRRAHHVSALLVAHDGARWLPSMLRTYADLTVRPDAIVAIDTGSSDQSALILRDALGSAAVIGAAADVGFGAALDAGVTYLDQIRPADESAASRESTRETVEWLWVLHDDCAPDVDALDALLMEADRSPSSAVIGPKVRGWHDRRLLLEAGLTVTGGGRRDTGLERHEQDQGQHDGVRDALAVGSAGMLIRRDVWDDLGGFDPEITMFRDDIDFGWRANLAGYRVVVATDAVVHHAEAGAHGRRRLMSVVDHPYRADRESSQYVALTHSGPVALPFVVLRLIGGAVIRSLGFLIGKDTASSLDELAAVAVTLSHPGRIRRGRSLVADAARIRGVGVSRARRDARHLLPSRGVQVRHLVEGLGAFLARRSVIRQVGAGLRTDRGTSMRAVETGPASEDDEWIDNQPSWLRMTLSRPGVIYGLLLTLGTLIGVRALLGSGVLVGGALLPSPDGASELWAQYTAGWHEVGPGSGTPQATYIAPLAFLATVLLGKAWLIVDILILLAVPLAGISAYAALRGLVSSTAIRIWASTAYALLPAVSGAVAAGRIGTTTLAILLPVLARAIARMVPAWRTDREGPPTWRRTWSTAVLLSIAVSFVPIVWLIALCVVVVAMFTVLTGRASRQRFAIVVAMPLLLLAPWSFTLLAHPSLFFFEAGLNSPDLTDRYLSALDVAVLHPGGPGMTPVWASVGLVLAAVVAWLRTDRFAALAACWAVGIVGLMLGLLDVVLRLTPPWAVDPVRAWPGPATLVVGAAAIGAGAIAAQGARERISTVRFGVVQPLVLVVLIAAIVGPVVAGVTFVEGVDGPIARTEASVVPAYVDADMRGPDRPRALVMRPEAGGRIGYALLGRPVPTIGDADAAPPGEVYAPIDAYVASLASGRGGSEVEGLARYAVRYVLLRGSGNPGTGGATGSGSQVAARRDADLVATLDSEPGLRRLSTTTGDALWRIALPGVPTSRVQAATTKAVAVSAIPVVRSETDIGPIGVDTIVKPDKNDRLLLVSESMASGWRATLGGDALPPLDIDGNQAGQQWFSLPARGGQLQVHFENASRTRWLWAQLFAFLVVVVLALPSRRRSFDPDPDIDPEADFSVVIETRVGSA